MAIARAFVLLLLLLVCVSATRTGNQSLAVIITGMPCRHFEIPADLSSVWTNNAKLVFEPLARRCNAQSIVYFGWFNNLSTQVIRPQEQANLADCERRVETLTTWRHLSFSDVGLNFKNGGQMGDHRRANAVQDFDDGPGANLESFARVLILRPDI